MSERIKGYTVEQAADSLVGQLITMGATKAHTQVLLEPTRERAVHIEHPELPGVLIIPVEDYLMQSVPEEQIIEHIVDRLERALSEERATPHGD